MLEKIKTLLDSGCEVEVEIEKMQLLDKQTNVMLEINKIYNMDCIEGMKMIPDGGMRFM